MDSITHTLALWEDEALVAFLTLLGVVLFHYATKLWSAPIDAILGVMLGASAGIAGAMLFVGRHALGFGLGTRAYWFAALYLWCVLAMLFFAARNTHRFKLFLGLVSQAGILYALFAWL